MQACPSHVQMPRVGTRKRPMRGVFACRLGSPFSRVAESEPQIQTGLEPASYAVLNG